MSLKEHQCPDCGLVKMVRGTDLKKNPEMKCRSCFLKERYGEGFNGQEAETNPIYLEVLQTERCPKECGLNMLEFDGEDLACICGCRVYKYLPLTYIKPGPQYLLK